MAMASNETLPVAASDMDPEDSETIFSWHLWHLVLLIAGCLLGLFLIIKRRMVCIVFKTMPRDFTGAYRAIPMFIRVRWFQWKNLTVHQAFDSVAHRQPNKICFYFEDEQWTFRDIEQFSNRIGNYFLGKGFRKGDTIGVFMENRPEYVGIWLGLAKIGVIPALINFNLRNKPLQHSLVAAQCKCLIYGAEVSEAVSELDLSIPLYEYGQASVLTKASTIDLKSVLVHSSPKTPRIPETINFNDVLLYIYTSGTTGLPKAAIIKHCRYLLMVVGCNSVQGIRSTDIFYTALPLYHSAGGMLGVGQAIICGISVVFRKKFSATNFWKDCIRYNVTVTQYIGEVCRYLLAQPPKPEDSQHKVRLMIGNGLRGEIWEEFTTRFNTHVSEVYGSTEGNCNLVNFDGKVGAVGFIPRLVACLSPVILIKVDPYTGEAIRDPKTGLTIRCKPNEPGELIGVINTKRPITDFEGYSDENSKAKKIIQNVNRTGDSGFRSGDILVMDDYGYYFFKDRIGDTFRWKGENVSTTEVESVINRLTNHSDSAVYGVQIPGTDGKAGMVAIVDPEYKLDLTELAHEIRTQLPSYARPLFVRLLKVMDTTGTFKLKRIDLQKDGFNINNVKDPVFFYSSTDGKFVVLNEELYKQIINGKVKV